MFSPDLTFDQPPPPRAGARPAALCCALHRVPGHRAARRGEERGEGCPGGALVLYAPFNPVEHGMEGGRADPLVPRAQEV